VVRPDPRQWDRLLDGLERTVASLELLGIIDGPRRRLIVHRCAEILQAASAERAEDERDRLARHWVRRRAAFLADRAPRYPAATMRAAVERVLEALRQHEGRPTRAGEGWTARCPAHEDRRASLSVNEGDDGRALIFCFAGCALEQITTALGLSVRDLFPAGEGGRG
jgi:hypothetical protein